MCICDGFSSPNAVALSPSNDSFCHLRLTSASKAGCQFKSYAQNWSMSILPLQDLSKVFQHFTANKKAS